MNFPEIIQISEILSGKGVYLFVWYALSFTLLATVFNRSKLLKTFKKDTISVPVYFALFFTLLFFIPFIYLLIIKANTTDLFSLGLSPGKIRTGMTITIIGIPISILVAYSGIKQTKSFYPFSKSSLFNIKNFLFIEFLYLIFYYTAWEFTFRGFFQGFITSSLPTFNGIVIGITIQTIISVLYHLGHPDNEIFGALFGGIIFGSITYYTQSILYAVILHSILGISTDSIIYIQTKKQK